MCNVANVFKVICLSLAVLRPVDSYTFRMNSTRIRHEDKGNDVDVKCANSSDFRCKSGECINEDNECNGIVDCQDASDETTDCLRIRCTSYLFRCQYGACISSEFECNGRTDCRDNSDETSPTCMNNTLPSGQCEDGQFRCNSGQCIHEDFKCDGKKDCPDESDETTAVCYSRICPGYAYRCKYGACVDGNAGCNGVIECFDGSDEDPDKCNPPKPKPTPPKPTPVPVPQTPGRGPSPEGGGCLLPNYPEFGKWTVHGSKLSYSPGMWVVTGTLLRLSCQNDYKLDGDRLILCEQGRWPMEIGRCLKTCPPLHSTPTTKIICIYNQETINCTDAVDGTRATFQCTPFHEDLGLSNKPILLCRDGSWDQRNPECTPACGRKSVTATPLIINGTTVQKGNYPWQVALYTTKSQKLICGGSLINQKMIITAAHCIANSKGIKKPKENYIVAVGKYYRPFNDSRDANETQFSPIYEMFIPEQYRGSIQNYLGDIAVIVTTNTFTISERVQPVCIDWGSNYASELSSPYENVYGYVTGWGFTTENANASDELKELIVPAVTYEQCNTYLPENFDVFLTYDKLCAGYIDQGTAVCSGDSGGGLVFKHEGRYYLTGIVSVAPMSSSEGPGCNKEQYGLYTSVYKYVDNFLLHKESEYRRLL